MSKEYGYIGKEVTQAFRDNKGIFTPQDIIELDQENKWTNFGQLELISTSTITDGSALILTDLKETIYNVHFYTFQYNPSENNRGINIQFSNDGGTSYYSSYQVAYQSGNGSGSFGETRSTSNSYLLPTFNTGNDTGETINSYGYLYNLGDSTKYSFNTSMQTFLDTAKNYYMLFGSSVLSQAVQINTIKVDDFSTGSYNLDFSLYGIRFA